MSDEYLDETTLGPLPPRFRLRDLILGDYATSSDGDSRFQVEFFTNERSLKERLQLYFIKNRRSSLRIRLFNFFLKFLTCLLYVARVEMDSDIDTKCFDNKCCWKQCNFTDESVHDEQLHGIHWDLILWVERTPAIYYMHVVIAFISFLQTILMILLSYKGNILQQLLSRAFILEIITTVPFICTLASPRWLQSLFIPVFLNMWLAKSILEKILNDVHRVINRTQSPLSHQLTVLISTIVTLIFVSACGIQHLQRGSGKRLNLFESLWFVVVTFSTVGYGDISPDIWPSRLFMMIMICLSLTMLPMQLEKLAFTWQERKKKGSSYSKHRARTEKHVVVCATHLQTDAIMDFLNEFYAHSTLEGYYVVLLSPSEMEESLKIILQIPIWSQRVIYIKGSALKDSDLQRCRMQNAEGCFILAARSHTDRTAADEHTILRSWAVRDHSPSVRQYVQLFRPDNKFHVSFAKHVVCEDEFKYALLAYNCLCPGVSSLVTLLLHTSRGDEGRCGNDNWQKLYGKCSGNEIYEIKQCDSTFFKEFRDTSFSYASFNAHKKYGVCLIGVQSSGVNSKLLLNPGPKYLLQESDTLFYLSITKEEHSKSRQKKQEPTAEEGIASVVAGVGMVASGVAGTATVNLSKENAVNIEMSSSAVTASASTSSDMKSLLLSPSSDNMGMRRPSIGPVEEKVDDALKIELTPLDLSRRSTVKRVAEIVDSPSPTDEHLGPLWSSHNSGSDIYIDVPPVAPYIGRGHHLCHLLRNPRPICCLQLAKACKHCRYQHAKEYNWRNRAIIIASDHTSNGIYNFVLPLRSHCLKQSHLRPIVLFLENEPERHFKETIRNFPMVYWITGSIDRLDDWLKAGINYADNIVVVNKETSNSAEDEYLSDCNTIVAVQTLFRLFPGAKIITELSQSSNMRFMQFRADDDYALQLSRLEKEVKRQGSHMSYMFRLPFSAGNVFSASMLDTLLYQAFVKEYLTTIVRLMCGIDQEKGSGFLTSIELGEDEQWLNTYGRLYQKLCSSSNFAIPIGIYRTQKSTLSGSSVQIERDAEMQSLASSTDKEEIVQLVKGCMQSLNLSPHDYNSESVLGKQREVSYVIINPAYDLPIEKGDIIYVLRPASKRQTARYDARAPVRSQSDIKITTDSPDEGHDTDSKFFLLGTNNNGNHSNKSHHYERQSKRRQTTKT
ncbi:potassium channel subfamily T member 2-like [Watersipora subatra]|uniref:potassium channel subfamily T member 2-like n=1 Tax=Watersipora subatra TaxID=2589382 RepID=UPI00355C144B